MVRGLLQRMTQQPLGIKRPVSCKRQCRKTAQGRVVTRILLQHAAENPLRGLAIVGHEGGRCRIDLRSAGVGEAAALEGHARVCKLLQIDQDISVRKPRQVLMRHFLEHSAHFLAGRLQSPNLPVRAGKIGACRSGAGSSGHRPFEHRYSLAHLVLGEQSLAEQPQTGRFTGRIGLDSAQLRLGGSSPPDAQGKVRLATGSPHRGLFVPLHCP